MTSCCRPSRPRPAGRKAHEQFEFLDGVNASMKLKRLTALLLAAAMAFSTAVTALPAYAEGEGGAASSQSAPDADSTPGGPVDDGEPNSGPSGDPVNGNTPGDPNSEPDGDPSGDPVNGNTPDNTNNDPSGDPAGDPTGDPGTQQGEECTCTALCTSAETKNTTWPVCSGDDWAKCAFEQVTVQFSFQNVAASSATAAAPVTITSCMSITTSSARFRSSRTGRTWTTWKTGPKTLN